MMYARYTVVLKTLMDDPAVKSKIDQALSTYPLYVKKSKEEYIPSIVPTREELNNKILNAYKYREIGFETVGRFLDELEISMNEIMPYYNQMFFSADQDYNILFNVDYERTTSTERDGTTTGETTTTGEMNTTSSATDTAGAKTINSKTPQNDLSITAANMDSVNYADEVNWSGSDGSTASTGKTTNNDSSNISGTNTEKEEMHERTFGNFGVMATQDLITKYRDLIINIEQQIINNERISELFMRVY